MAKKFLEKRKIYQYLMLLGLFAFIAVSFYFTVKPEFVQGTVQRVIDGDTLVVVDGKHERRVRLLYIDAPEMDQVAFQNSREGKKLVQLGEMSKNYLSQLVEGKEVVLKIKNRDHYGRDLAVVYLNNENINLKLVRDGFAVVYWYAQFTGEFTKEMFMEATDNAFMKKLGIWAVDSFYDPYKWRQKKRKKLKTSKKPLK
ncbi:MAG: thermonuclease family protein [Halobacteriovoraceae bacterium]|nr:thermonuclease family protein [Halobacteriovoraceae bacterium]MCB9093812.1 thermonuclease family protein [Halobacteriovoraceae bacterium]